MILYSKEQKAISAQGVLGVNLNDDKGFLYITTSLFAQLISLETTYGTVANLIEKVHFESNQGAVVKDMQELLPAPFNFLAPFINLIDQSEVPLSKLDLETAFGLLGIVAKDVDFVDYTRGEHSTHLKYSTPILVDYELSCKDVECTFGLIDVEVEDETRISTLSDTDGTVWGGDMDDPIVVESPEYLDKIDGLVKHYSKYLKKDHNVKVGSWKEDTEYTKIDENTESLEGLNESEISFIDKEMERLKEEFSKDLEGEETELL
jgi:hypothetical protein